MPFKDINKKREAQRKHYAANSEKIKKTTYEWKVEYRNRNRQFIRDIKAVTPCTDCGVIYPHYVMQFDHVLGNKRANVADLAHSSVSLEVLQTEIDKCELVCANCHAERTHGIVAEDDTDFTDLPDGEPEA